MAYDLAFERDGNDFISPPPREVKHYQMMVWEPIETAPRDGSPILLYVVKVADEYTRAVGQYDGWRNIDVGYWELGLNDWHTVHSGEPTHWMPLPPAPQPMTKGTR